jgi:hypothetical protein
MPIARSSATWSSTTTTRQLVGPSTIPRVHRGIQRANPPPGASVVEDKRRRSLSRSASPDSAYDAKRQRRHSPPVDERRTPPLPDSHGAYPDSPGSPRADVHHASYPSPPRGADDYLSPPPSNPNSPGAMGERFPLPDDRPDLSDRQLSYSITLPASVSVCGLLGSGGTNIKSLCTRWGLTGITIRDRLTHPSSDEPTIDFRGPESAIRRGCDGIERALRRFGGPSERWVPRFDPNRLEVDEVEVSFRPSARSGGRRLREGKFSKEYCQK